MGDTTTPEHWVIAVCVIVRNARGKVLMLKRHLTSKHFPGLWELPGGKPAPGENFAESAKREVYEETGLQVTATGVAGAVEERMPELRVVTVILEGRATESKITLSREHESYLWVTPSRICSLKLRPSFNKFFARHLVKSRQESLQGSSSKKADVSIKRRK